MWKTVQKEYVGIEDFQEIADSAFALIKEGHYVSVELSNYGNIDIVVNIMLGGWQKEKNYDYQFIIPFDDTDYAVKTMNECKNVLNNLLASEEE